MAKKNNKKFKKTINIIGILLSTLLILCFLAFIIVVSFLNILPLKYFIPLILVLALFVLLFSLTLFKPKFKLWLKYASMLLSILFIIVFLMAIFYINRTYDFMSKIKSKYMITEVYYVLVNKDSNYNSVEDLKDKNIETFNEDTDIYNNALDKLKQLSNFNINEVDSVETMCKDLINGKTDAILISAMHKETTDQQLVEFSDSTKVLYTIEIKVKVNDHVKHVDVDVTKEVFTIYLTGIDSFGSILRRSNSDVNMLITVNPKTHEILLTSIPRDYYVPLYGKNGAKDKLTHTGMYGVNTGINTIENFLNVNIDYYIKVNFSTVLDIIDIIDGVDVYSDQTLTTRHYNCKITQGNNHLNGECALGYVRERYSYIDGDRHRIKNQQDVLAAMIKKATTSTSILTKYTTILNKLSQSFETNIETDDITTLIKLQLDKMPTWTIKQYSLNGTDLYAKTYSFGSQQLYVMEPKEETVNQAHDYIEGMEQGKTFSELGIN